MTDFGRETLKTLLSGTPDERATKISTLVIPGFVLSCILSQFTGLGMLAGSENSITSVQLPMYWHSKRGGLKGEGTVFILEPEVGDFVIPWDTSSLDRVWLSIDPESYGNNDSNLQIDESGIAGTLPLLGDNKPIVLVTEGGKAGWPLIRGKRLKTEKLGLYSREGTSKALWSFVMSMFGFGLVIRTPDGTERTTGTDSEQSTRRDDTN